MCRAIGRTTDIDKQNKLKKSICIICAKSDGFLKKLKIEKEDKTNWIHIGCMSWFIGIKLVFEDGFSIFKADKKFEDYIWMAEECYSCKKTGKDYFIKCSKHNCNKYFHSKCAAQMTKCIDHIYSDKINYKIFVCEEHASKKVTNALADVKPYGKNVNESSNNINIEDNLFILPDTKTM